MRKIIIIFLIIFLCLVFAWWAAGEVYNPRPTPTHAIPTHITATDAPAVTAIVPVTEIVVVTEAPAPTATATMIPIVILPTATYYPLPTQVITSTPVLSFIVHDDCYTARYNVFGIIDRLSTCSYIKQ